MHDDVARVDEYPLAGVFAFDTEDLSARFLDLLADVVGERLHLSVGVGRRDDQAIV